jgi:2-keto-3-deoxy-L-rhamnonate aldolase RhmA
MEPRQILDMDTTVGATAFALFQIKEHTASVDGKVFDTHLAPAVNRGVDSTAPRTDRWGNIVREHNNQVKVVILAIEDIDHNNVWEVEKLRDSLEMHRIWHPF